MKNIPHFRPVDIANFKGRIIYGEFLRRQCRQIQIRRISSPPVQANPSMATSIAYDAGRKRSLAASLQRHGRRLRLSTL